MHSGDEYYPDEITSGPQRRNDIEEMREINFDEAAAEARAPLFIESADPYDDGPESDGDDYDLDDLTDEQLKQLETE